MSTKALRNSKTFTSSSATRLNSSKIVMSTAQRFKAHWTIKITSHSLSRLITAIWSFTDCQASIRNTTCSMRQWKLSSSPAKLTLTRTGQGQGRFLFSICGEWAFGICSSLESVLFGRGSGSWRTEVLLTWKRFIFWTQFRSLIKSWVSKVNLNFEKSSQVFKLSFYSKFHDFQLLLDHLSAPVCLITFVSTHQTWIMKSSTKNACQNLIFHPNLAVTWTLLRIFIRKLEKVWWNCEIISYQKSNNLRWFLKIITKNISRNWKTTHIEANSFPTRLIKKINVVSFSYLNTSVFIVEICNRSASIFMTFSGISSNFITFVIEVTFLNLILFDAGL